MVYRSHCSFGSLFDIVFQLIRTFYSCPLSLPIQTKHDSRLDTLLSSDRTRPSEMHSLVQENSKLI